MADVLERMILPDDLSRLTSCCKSIVFPESRNELLELAIGGTGNDFYEVAYDVPGMGPVVEATVTRCKNGIVVNYTDVYLRRRDPECMVIGDEGATDKQRYKDVYHCGFHSLRMLTFGWLAQQDLILMPFMAGDKRWGYPALIVAPKNASFFVGGLADLQGFIPAGKLEDGFRPKAVIFLAPTFRHTHFGGKQMVVHNRMDETYELFSYNLYPGPSAKKGVYGVLLKIGEEEGWVTVHGSTVKVITPYDNVITIMHEGASGGGKSEMTEQLHRERSGKILIGTNLQTSEQLLLDLKETCELRPVTDDMALCHPDLQNGSRKLTVVDAEDGWFIRTNHIKGYGTDPYLESMCIHPKEPLIFLNFDAAPNSTCLIWEHIMDAPGRPCPNPRVIMPRRLVPNIVNEPVEIDVRSFGVRTPPCTAEKPSYGIIGLIHLLPPALAWLWRLVAPRGYDNPSITDAEGMVSEGVGSYWPFATGKIVDQANLLLRQILESGNTRYILIPNQHIGAYMVGFMPQWIAREYLALRGSARFHPHQMAESRCRLLGYSLTSVKVEGTYLPVELLQVHQQPEVGVEGYDLGAGILEAFFKKELTRFADLPLDPLGRRIVECCMDDGSMGEYAGLIPMKF